MRITLFLAVLAALASALLAFEVLVQGTPALGTVIVTAIVVGMAAAWPVARRQEMAVVRPACRECGSGLLAEFGFCIHCGWMPTSAVRR